MLSPMAEGLLEMVRREALAARGALPLLTDELVERALRRAADALLEKTAALLSANDADVESASETLDPGALDRLRLDEVRLEAIAEALRATAMLAPIEREASSWSRRNGLQISERRIPVGVIGANFEARPGVAADIASQVLKSGNAVVLRTGSVALKTVTCLVDEVLRPSLGLAADAIGLVRFPDRSGAEVLVSLPDALPLVILRGSGESTAALVRVAAAHGVRTLAHAEGGGVLYVHVSADRAKLDHIVRASLDRLGVCNRLNLVLADTAELAEVVADICRELALDVRGETGKPLDRSLGHEWASEPARVSTVTVAVVSGVDEAVRIANEETSGLAASIVCEDSIAAERFLENYRGTAGCWNASTRFTDGFELLGTPETGINVDRVPGPRGPVTYRDLFLRQYRVVGDGTESR